MDAPATSSRHHSLNRGDAGDSVFGSSGRVRDRTTDCQSLEKTGSNPFPRPADRLIHNRCHASFIGLDEQLWAAAVSALEWTLVLWRPVVYRRSLHLVVVWRGLLSPYEQFQIADSELGDPRIRIRNVYRCGRVAKRC